MASNDQQMIDDLFTKGFPKEVTQACLSDGKCKNKLMDKYMKVLEVTEISKYQSEEMQKASDVCYKDTTKGGCAERATEKYLGNLDARNSKLVLESTELGVKIGYNIAKFILIILILWILYIWIRTLLDPNFITNLIDTIGEAISNAFSNIQLPF